MDMISIGKRIKEIRNEHGFSQQKFGALLSVSQDTVSLWEKGKSVPTTEFLIAIAKQFDISTDYILCLKDY
ncbi:MAG: helix-turn-helix transcriptional regulator [Clostridia bacterium]|nr:helix-turn-helix transcriptional regulator [Clostridia bacterium]